MFDVIIVGGGPAGLSAALVLGRCRRRVLLYDDGRPRNRAAHAVHGFFTRDGTPPDELLRMGREQLRPYPGVQLRDVTVVSVRCSSEAFEVRAADGQVARGRKLLLATGLTDELPGVPGAAELYGRSVFHCPYCDGWELRDQPLAAYGIGDAKGGDLALELLLWSADVVLCSDGPARLSDAERALLTRRGVHVREERVARLTPEGDGMRVHFEGGATLARRAMFFNTRSRQRSAFIAELGCGLDEKGCARVGIDGVTEVQGLYVAGDVSSGARQVVIAAAQGAAAAIAINSALLAEDLR